MTAVNGGYGTIVSPSFIDEGNPFTLGRVHVKPLLKPDEVAKCYELALEYARDTKCWEGGKMDGTQHSNYNTVDFPLIAEFYEEEEYEEYDDDSDIDSSVVKDSIDNFMDSIDGQTIQAKDFAADNPLAIYLQEINFNDRIYQKLEGVYGVPADVLEYEDLFCVQYIAKGDDELGTGMNSLDLHRDGTLFSFTVLLSDPDSFECGGTVFDCMRGMDVKADDDEFLMKDGAITPLHAGDCVLHSGKMLHGGQTVTKGSRVIIVGFVMVPEWCCRPGVLTEACKDWGRVDVADKMAKRHAMKSEGGAGFMLRNNRWLSGTGSSAAYNGYLPTNPSVLLRADAEVQRLARLRAETNLLRDILLPEDERDPTSIFGGEITSIDP